MQRKKCFAKRHFFFLRSCVIMLKLADKYACPETTEKRILPIKVCFSVVSEALVRDGNYNSSVKKRRRICTKSLKWNWQAGRFV